MSSELIVLICLIILFVEIKHISFLVYMKPQRSIVLLPEALCLLPLTITHIAKDASTHITLIKAKGLCFKPRLVPFLK